MSLLKNSVKCQILVNSLIKNTNHTYISQMSTKAFSCQQQEKILNKTCDTRGLKKYCTAPKNPLEEFYSAGEQAEKGVIYDKKPFKMVCEEGKKYSWCVCGKSKSQPLCDGTHKNVFLKIKLRPVRFTVKETKEYYLCNCKQTSNRPFCDGTHKLEIVQGSNVKTN